MHAYPGTCACRWQHYCTRDKNTYTQTLLHTHTHTVMCYIHMPQHGPHEGISLLQNTIKIIKHIKGFRAEGIVDGLNSFFYQFRGKGNFLFYSKLIIKNFREHVFGCAQLQRNASTGRGDHVFLHVTAECQMSSFVLMCHIYSP